MSPAGGNVPKSQFQWAFSAQPSLAEKIDDVNVLDEEKELATDDGDTRNDTEDKTPNDSDMESDE